MRFKSILLILFLLVLTTIHTGGQSRDSDRLGMALEYFQTGKYHEALLLFEQLDKHYDLNARYHAYMGVCYYYEWNFKKAIQYLDEAMPKLENFSPHERSLYYYCNAESHFNLEKYQEAIPLYLAMLPLCYENEKPDAYYRLGFCYMFDGKWQEAHENFTTALTYYKQYRDTPDLKGRITQIEKMTKGIEKDYLMLDSTKQSGIKSFPDSIQYTPSVP